MLHTAKIRYKKRKSGANEQSSTILIQQPNQVASHILESIKEDPRKLYPLVNHSLLGRLLLEQRIFAGYERMVLQKQDSCSGLKLERTRKGRNADLRNYRAKHEL